MADVSYESLQSQIGEQKTQIASQREFIRQERDVGERSIETARRVHPKTPPEVWFGERKPRIESIRGRLGELKQSEQKLVIAEQKISEQEQLLASKKAEGWKIREKNGEFEFYREMPVSPAVGVGEPRGEFTVRVRWMDYRTKPEGERKTVLVSSSRLESTQQQISDRGGQIIEVESLGGGRELREPSMRETTGGGFILFETEPIIRQPAVPIPEEKRIGDITVRRLGMGRDVDLGFGERPKKEEVITDAEVLLGKQLGLGKAKTFIEMHRARYITFLPKYLAFKEKELEVEQKKIELKRLMTGSPVERLAGLGLWVTTGMLSWEDPFGIPSAYYALRGEPEKAIETKARAIVGVPLGKPWSPERFKFLERAFTGPVAMVGWTYAISTGLGAGIGAFEATTVGKYPLLISKGVKVTTGVAKPIWTFTPAKAIEIGIGGYFGYKAIEQAIPVIAKAKEEDDYGPLAGYLGSLGIYGYAGIKGYKLGKVYGYGRAEEFLYLRETYAPGTKEYIRFQSALKVARELYPIKPKDISTLDLAKTVQKLKPTDVKELYAVLLEKKRVITIAGSTATYPQIRGARLPRDIDLLVSGWKRNVGIIQTKLQKVSKVHVHGKEFGYPGQYRRFGFLYQARQKITVLGPKGELLTSKALRASEQLFRKGITSVLKEERLRHGILPGYDFPLKGTRPILKDIFDFVTISRSLITDAYKSSSIFIKGRAIRAEIALKDFLYPEKAPSFIKGALPVKPKQFFWKRAIVAPEVSPDVLLFKGDFGFPYPIAYPVGVGLGYVPSVGPSDIPSYMLSLKIAVPPYVPPYEPPDYIPGYMPTAQPSYQPSDYIPGYVPTPSPPPYVPPYQPSDYIPRYVPPPPPPYIPPYQPPDYIPGYTPTAQPPYIPSYQPPYGPGYAPTITPIPPPPRKKIMIPDTTYKMFGHTMGQGYHTYVKERTHFEGIKKIKKGKMIRLDKRPLSQRNALSLGGMAVDNSAAATFEIRPTNAMAQEPLIKLKPFNTFQDKFYMKDDKYIEKPKYRIDTKGEVQGIPALAWYVEKTKKAVKRKPVVDRRPRVRKDVDMFDMRIDKMITNMNKIFKGVMNIGIR